MRCAHVAGNDGFTVELVLDVEVVDEIRVDAQHALGEVGVQRRRCEQTDM